jgi:fatty acid synthase
MTWEEACAQCPAGVVPACHNSEDTVTISGPKEAVNTFVNQLKENNIFAKEVNSSGVAFHSYNMVQIAPVLKAALEKVCDLTSRLKCNHKNFLLITPYLLVHTVKQFIY